MRQTMIAHTGFANIILSRPYTSLARIQPKHKSIVQTSRAC